MASQDWYVKKGEMKLPEGFKVVDAETQTTELGLRPVDGGKLYMLGQTVKSEQETEYGPVAGLRVTPRDHAEFHDALKEVWKSRVLIGHNIKYDLSYLRATDHIGYLKWRSAGCVLDTQYITYLHSGHKEKFCTLERAAEYWGVQMTKTFDLGAELAKNGGDISKVENLSQYLKTDVEITLAIAEKMMEDPWVIGNFKWILAMHDGLLGTFEIEWNGMSTDLKAMSELNSRASLELNQAARLAYQRIVDIHATTAHTAPADWLAAININSNAHVAAIIFGGEIKYKTTEPTGTVYKTGAKAGQPKFKKVEKTLKFRPITPLKPTHTETEKTKVDDDVLKAVHAGIRTKVPPNEAEEDLLESLLKIRNLNKILGTYLDGLHPHLRQDVDHDFYIHPSINTCATATGRTSSTKPNLQNIKTGGDFNIGSIFNSRFKDGGVCIEVDYKQLEILGLATLSGDAQLIRDIIDGRDIHTETGKSVYTGTMTKEQRRSVKAVNFGLIYGGGAATCAAQAGIMYSEAAALISAFYKRYPQTKTYFERNHEVLNALMDTAGKVVGNHDNGKPEKELVWQSRTGRRYCYKTYPNRKTYGEEWPEVSYTEARNYPIQGLATADLMLAMLGRVWRFLLPKYEGSVKLVGLVHDSLRFDALEGCADAFLDDLKELMTDAGRHLALICYDPKLFATLPLNVSVSRGPDFGNLKEDV